MEPQTYNFKIYQGATWSRSMIYKTEAGAVVNLSAYSARMTFRVRTGGAVVLALTSSPAAGITLAATSPNISIRITPAQTRALLVTDPVYDLEIESPSGDVDPLIRGRASVVREITT